MFSAQRRLIAIRNPSLTRKSPDTEEGHLEKVGKGVLVIIGGLGNGGPHLLEVLLPGLNQARQGRLRAVPEHKQQHRAPLVGGRREQLQVHLHGAGPMRIAHGSRSRKSLSF